jgi:hypothetical protein
MVPLRADRVRARDLAAASADGGPADGDRAHIGVAAESQMIDAQEKI